MVDEGVDGGDGRCGEVDQEGKPDEGIFDAGGNGKGVGGFGSIEV